MKLAQISYPSNFFCIETLLCVNLQAWQTKTVLDIQAHAISYFTNSKVENVKQSVYTLLSLLSYHRWQPLIRNTLVSILKGHLQELESVVSTSCFILSFQVATKHLLFRSRYEFASLGLEFAFWTKRQQVVLLFGNCLLINCHKLDRKIRLLTSLLQVLTTLRRTCCNKIVTKLTTTL